MKILKQTLISMFTALLTSVFVYGGYTIYAEDARDALYEEGLDYYEVFDVYHSEMNDIFNRKLELMVELVDSGDYLKDPEKEKLFVIPEDIDRTNDSLPTIVDKCTRGEQENVSTYCLSMEGLYLYTEYISRLESLSGENLQRGSSSVSEYLLEVDERNTAIALELEQAKEVLEGATSVYQEFAHAYPMHGKYKEIINELLKYKLSLKDIRKEVQFFPTKFIDATSSQCK